MDHLAGSTMDELSRMTPGMPILIRMIKYYYVWLRMQYRKLQMISVANPALSP